MAQLLEILKKTTDAVHCKEAQTQLEQAAASNLPEFLVQLSVGSFFPSFDPKTDKLWLKTDQLRLKTSKIDQKLKKFDQNLTNFTKIDQFWPKITNEDQKLTTFCEFCPKSDKFLVLANPQNDELCRFQAALQLKNHLVSNNSQTKLEYQQRWLMIDKGLRDQVKTNSFNALGSETR